MTQTQPTVTASEGGPTEGAEPVYLLIGNPNTGKTSLFNALTGLRQKVANYPGVTVERKEGICFSQHGKKLRIVDLPGTYSLSARSPDEVIALEVLLARRRDMPKPTGVICVADATNLERNLFLLTQIIELGWPVVVALTFGDVAESRGIRVDHQALARHLGVPVIPCHPSGKGLVELRLEISRELSPPARPPHPLPEALERAVQDVAPVLKQVRAVHPGLLNAEALLLLQGEPHLNAVDPVRTRAALWQQRLDREVPGWRSSLIAQRYARIGDIIRECVRRFDPTRASWTERLDRVLLHPIGGYAVLVGVMGLLFYAIFSLAVPFMDAIDAGFGWLGAVVEGAMPAGPLRELVVDGVIAGVGGVVIFLPQILLLFFLISLLETSGYLARAAFLLDKVMSRVGLHGRSFVPLLSSYACAIPGIMATRTIESPKDRLATILVAPFMSCSARLPVYLVMIAALVPPEQGGAGAKAGIMLGLYGLGTGMAFVCAAILKRTLLRGPTPSLVMELPSYQRPRARQVGLDLLDRSKVFLRRAGTVIFALSILIWFAMHYPRLDEGVEAGPGEELRASFAGRAGVALEPVFAPLGYDEQITVGILASLAAREVFVSTMAIMLDAEEDDEGTTLLAAMQAQRRADGTPLFTPLTCLSILVFFVFALQCLSTVAVVRRETNSWRWPLFQVAYMFAVAWVAGAVVYQGGRLLGLN